MLRLHLFGGFALHDGDEAPIVIASRKCRALLAYLALAPRPVPRERLASLLWGEGGEARARASLRQALTTLRREVPGDGDWLDASAEVVAIDPARLWVDARAAEAALGKPDLEAALELCGRGNLCAGVGAGAPEFDEWREGEERRWREWEASALEALIRAARAEGRERDLLAPGRRLVRRSPWNEDGHRAVMQGLAAFGRYSEALRHYQVAKEALRTGLGVAPAAETERLLIALRARRLVVPAADQERPAAEDDGRSAPDTPPTVDPTIAGSEASAASFTPAPSATGPIGRELEERQIEGLLEGCRLSGRGHVVLIRGEAGMGKTTLLNQALARARAAGVATHLIEVSEYGGGRNVDVVRGVLGALEAPALTPPEHRLAIDELIERPLGPQDAALAAAIAPAARAEAHLRAVEAQVAAAGARAARIIAIEDLHWSDPETVRVLCAVAAAAPQHRTVVVFTCRSGEEPNALDWVALLRRGSITSIDLGPLRREDAARLAARFETGVALVERCLARAAGHPLFLMQLLGSGQADVVPRSVQAAVVARLAGVASEDRRVLEGAAVLATPFSLEEMAWLLEQDAVEPGRLVARGWLRWAGARLHIAHDLVASAIRSALPPTTLAHWHRRAAEWFSARDPLNSADHLARADDPGAAAAYLSVAREALRERRLEQAESVLDRVDACPAPEALAFEAACLRGDLRLERSDPAGAQSVFARAARQASTAEQHVRAGLGLGAALRLLDRHDEALAAVDQADAHAAPDDHLHRTRIEQLRGNLRFSIGDLAGCTAAQQRALAHARQAESAPDEAAAHSGLGDAAYLAGRLTTAHRAFEDCVALARAHGLLRIEAASSCMLALTFYYANRVSDGLAAVDRTLAIAAEIGDQRLLCLGAAVASSVRRNSGDWATVRAFGEQAQAAARKLGSERFEAMGIEAMARAAVGEGRREEALAYSRHAMRISLRSGGMPVSGPSLLATRAQVETDAEASAQALREGEALLARPHPLHNYFDLREAGIALALERGDLGEATRHAQALLRELAEPSPRAELLATAVGQLVELARDPRAPVARAALERTCAGAEAAGLVLVARTFTRHLATFTAL